LEQIDEDIRISVVKEELTNWSKIKE
jgi:hypothetical protein